MLLCPPPLFMKRSKLSISGIKFMIASACAFSIMGLAVKLAAEDIHPFQVVFFRSFVGLLIILFFIHRKKVSLFGNEKKLMVLRGISGFLALLLHFYTIKHLELGTAITLNYMAPIFVCLFSARFLGEKPSRLFYGLIFISFAGVAMMNLQKGLVWDTNIAIAVLSAVFASVAYLSIRSIKKKESPFTVIFYFTGISTLGSLFFISTWTWPSFQSWGLIAVIGVGSFYGQLWLTTAMRRAPAWLASPFIYLNPVLSSIYGLILFGEGANHLFWGGLALIVVSGILISLFGAQRPAAAGET